MAWEALTAEEEARRASYAILYARQEARDGVIKSKRVEMVLPVPSPPLSSARCDVPPTSDRDSCAEPDGEWPLVGKEEVDIDTSTQHLWAEEAGCDVSPFPFLQSETSTSLKGSQRKKGHGQKQRTRRGGPSRTYDNELG